MKYLKKLMKYSYTTKENPMYYFIINPKSQSGKSMELWRSIKKELETKKSVRSYVTSIANIDNSQTFSKEYTSQQLEYRYVYSRYPGHITEIVKRLSKSQTPKHLIILGGDGSFNEAINGLQNAEFHKLSFLPSGSGNDLGRSLCFPDTPSELLSMILDNSGFPDTPMDLGRIRFSKQGQSEEKLFAVSAGVGFDAAICEDTNTSPLKPFLNRFHLGKLAYLLLGIKQLLLWKPQKAQIWIDDEAEPQTLDNFLFLSAHIHPYEGGGFPFCPDADYKDGYLDLCIVSGISRLQALFLIPLAKQGRHVGKPGILSVRCKKARIELESPVPIHTDGETPGHIHSLEVESNTYGYRFY